MKIFRRWIGLVITVQLVAVAAAGTAGADSRPDPGLRAAVKSVPVLGSARFWPGHYDKGFGQAHPKTIFNGGDPSGLVTHIRWQHWGAKRAIGWGKTSIFKPHGGYYPQPVRAELRVSRLGRCTKHGPSAYRHLEAREPAKPGGKLGKWFSWSGAKTICRPTG